jgi:hypothetical protein
MTSGSAPAATVQNGVVVNELQVLEGSDPAGLQHELARLGGVVVSHDPRLGTYQVRFPARSLADLTRIKDALAAMHISANLVFALPTES